MGITSIWAGKFSVSSHYIKKVQIYLSYLLTIDERAFSIVEFQFLSPVIHRILRVGYLAFLPRATAYRPKQDAQAEHLAEVGEERSQS